MNSVHIEDVLKRTDELSACLLEVTSKFNEYIEFIDRLKDEGLDDILIGLRTSESFERLDFLLCFVQDEFYLAELEDL